MKFRSYRDSTAEGYVTFQMTWFEVMDWVHEVMLMMTNCVVFKIKRQLFQEGAVFECLPNSLCNISSNARKLVFGVSDQV